MNVEPDYQPQTVNADGWSATRLAWEALFTEIVVLRCFLHGWLNIRKRGKHLKDTFWQVGEKVWNAFRAENRQSMTQRLRRRREWGRKNLTKELPRTRSRYGIGGRYIYGNDSLPTIYWPSDNFRPGSQRVTVHKPDAQAKDAALCKPTSCNKRLRE